MRKIPRATTNRIYLDHAATTPLLPQARAAAEAWLSCGNASSLAEEGRTAKAAIDEARETLSDGLNALFAEILFTSGGTESASMALIGAALAREPDRRRVLVGATEHHCVHHATPMLEALGLRVDVVLVDREAVLDLEHLDDLLAEDVLLVACMHANNELGTLNPISDVAELAHAKGALLFVDAVQTCHSAGLAPWTVEQLPADLISLSAHKFGGPKGAGALYVRAGTRLKPLIAGGGQERELRGGTENVAAIAGMAAAFAAPLPPSPEHLRNRLELCLARLGAVPTVLRAQRLDGHCHIRFPGIDAETILIRLDRLGLSASSGAACSSGSVEPSHVLLACGYSAAEAREGLRFTLGAGTTDEDITGAVERVAEALKRG